MHIDANTMKGNSIVAPRSPRAVDTPAHLNVLWGAGWEQHRWFRVRSEPHQHALHTHPGNAQHGFGN